MLRCGLWNNPLWAAVSLTDNSLNLLWVDSTLSGSSGVIGKIFHSLYQSSWTSGLLRCGLWNDPLWAAVFLTDNSLNLLGVDSTLSGSSGAIGKFFHSTYGFSWGFLRCGLWNIQLWVAVCLSDRSLNLLWVDSTLSGSSGAIGKVFHSLF